MKAKIHPAYDECKITCICGNVITTRSTRKELDIAVCGKCHPFYTGQQRYVDTAGRIEKFQKRFQIGEGQSTDAVVRKTQQKSKKQILAEARVKEREEKKRTAGLKKESKTAERKAHKAEGKGKGKGEAKAQGKGKAEAGAKPKADAKSKAASKPKTEDKGKDEKPEA
jgi:large subunit ribosomal protein L31